MTTVYVAATAFRRRSVYHRDPTCRRLGVRYDRNQRRYVPSCGPMEEAAAAATGLRPCPRCCGEAKERSEPDA